MREFDEDVQVSPCCSCCSDEICPEFQPVGTVEGDWQNSVRYPFCPGPNSRDGETGIHILPTIYRAFSRPSPSLTPQHCLPSPLPVLRMLVSCPSYETNHELIRSSMMRYFDDGVNVNREATGEENKRMIERWLTSCIVYSVLERFAGPEKG